MTKKRKWDPSVKTERWDPRNEFDVVAVGAAGSVLWRDYGEPRRYVITRGDESPRDVARKRDEEERAKRGAVSSEE